MAQVLHEYIRGMAAEAEADCQSDRVLLQRFAARQDDRAFRAIVRRHGPIVLQACQRCLKRREDAEDVFQATFLVLACKAGSVNWSESVGNWLYGVAYRLAQEARRKQLGRQHHEARARARTTEDPLAEVTGRELVSILDEELSSLPGRYRAPLLLHVQGKSDDEAAGHLGYSLSTFKRRLRCARELLEGRLKRRGFVLPAALTALLLANTASAKVPPTLLAATVEAAALLAKGKALPAGLVSAEAVALASGLTHALFLVKLKVALGALLAAVVLAGAWTLTRPPVREPHVVAGAAPDRRPVPPVAASILTTLATEAGQIRQFAFDGDADTFFASARNAQAADHFTLVFDRPVAVSSLAVLTGRPDGDDGLEDGTLEVSADGRRFETLARFAGGSAGAWPEGRWLRAVRVRPAGDLHHPLAIREFTIESDPPVAVFKYPVEFVVDVSDAPEMKPWADRTARICERTFPMINEELRGDGSWRLPADGPAGAVGKPVHVITMTLKHDFAGPIAEAENDHITGSVQYFKTHPDDVGAMVFLTATCVQERASRDSVSWLAPTLAGSVGRWRDEFPALAHARWDRAPFLGLLEPWASVLAGRTTPGNNPRWLEQGIADYVRYFKYEPGKMPPVDIDRARYDDGFRTSALFLQFLTQRYDKDIVRKLNQILGAGGYREDVFQTLTGKTLPQLNEEWRASLRRDPDVVRARTR